MKNGLNHSTPIAGAKGLVEYINTLPCVKSCRGGVTYREGSHYRGVEVKRVKNFILTTLYADDGKQSFTIRPEDGLDLERFESDLKEAIGHKYSLVERGPIQEMPRVITNELQIRAYGVLRAAAKKRTINGKVGFFVRDIRSILRPAGFDEVMMNRIQSNKYMLRKVGKNNGIVEYELPDLKIAGEEDVVQVVEDETIVIETERTTCLTPETLPVETEEQALNLSQIGVDRHLLETSLYALWEKDEREVKDFETEVEDCDKEIVSMDEEMEVLRKKIQDVQCRKSCKLEIIAGKKEEMMRLDGILDRFRS